MIGLGEHLTIVERIDEAIEKVDMLRKRRDAIDPASERELLSAPGCERGCGVCARACAVTCIMLNWWENELATLTCVRTGTGRMH